MTLFPVHVGTYIHTYTWLTIKILIPFLQTHFIWSHVYTIDLYLLRVQVLVCTMWHMNSKWLLVVNTTSTAAAATTSAAAATAIMCKNWVGIGPMLAARGRYTNMDVACHRIPADPRCNDIVIMTSKRRCDIVLTSYWRYYCIVCPLRWVQGLFKRFIQFRHKPLKYEQHDK